jgi:flagellar biosynthesis component FlhA
LLEHLGHRLQPLLPALLAITLRLLQQATAPVAAQQQQQQQQQNEQQQQQKSEQDEQQQQQQQQNENDVAPEDDRSREIRSSCLKLLAQVRKRTT